MFTNCCSDCNEVNKKCIRFVQSDLGPGLCYCGHLANLHEQQTDHADKMIDKIRILTLENKELVKDKKLMESEAEVARLSRTQDFKRMCDVSTENLEQATATDPFARNMAMAPKMTHWIYPDSEVDVCWDAPWEEYRMRDTIQNKEKSVIQPKFTAEFASAHTSNKWTIHDTHDGKNMLTHDMSMCVAGCEKFNALSIALIIELTGQTVSGNTIGLGEAFPDAHHLAKLFRDMLRVVELNGRTRPIEAAITDLYYIICFRMWFDTATGMLKLWRTVLEEGSQAVKARLLPYLKCSPEQYGIARRMTSPFNVELLKDSSIVQLSGESRLGGGAQGEVLRVSGGANQCLKVLRDFDDFTAEVHALKILATHNVSGVIQLLGVTKDGSNTLLLSPVFEATLDSYRNTGTLEEVWPSLVKTLQSVHNAGLAYRDFRPSNFLVREEYRQHGDVSHVICVIDFATAVPLDKPHKYRGTIRHAANAVLEQLTCVDGELQTVCTRKTDLEGLVKMVWGLNKPYGLDLNGMPTTTQDGIKNILVWWKDAEKSDMISDKTAQRLTASRDSNYMGVL